MRVDLKQGTPEWEAFRRGKIGSSDAPVIAGESPYRTPFQLWTERVTGERLPVEESTRRLFRIGHLMEGPLIAYYSQERGVEVERGPVFLSDDDPLFSASLDGLAGDRIIEAKWSNSDDWPSEGVPDHVRIQAQHQMYVAQLEIVDVVAMIRGWLRIVEVPRDPGMIDDLLSLEQAFARAVESRVPLPDWIDGSEGTRRAIQRLYPDPTEGMVPADAQMERLVAEVLDLKQDQKTLTEELETQENALRFLIGEAEGVIGPGFRVTYRKNRDSTKVGWEQVASTYGRLLLESGIPAETVDTIRGLYTVVIPGPRVLRVNRVEEGKEQEG